MGGTGRLIFFSSSPLCLFLHQDYSSVVFISYVRPELRAIFNLEGAFALSTHASQTMSCWLPMNVWMLPCSHTVYTSVCVCLIYIYIVCICICVYTPIRRNMSIHYVVLSNVSFFSLSVHSLASFNINSETRLLCSAGALNRSLLSRSGLHNLLLFAALFTASYWDATLNKPFYSWLCKG